MDKIKLKPNREPIDLNGDLFLKAYEDSKSNIQKGAIKSTITMGVVEIGGISKFVSIVISDY